MASSGVALLFSSSFLIVLVRVTVGEPGMVCPASYCHPGGPLIRFPFRIIGLQDERCGYPGFEISCDIQGRAILHMPHSGDLVVRSIDYVEQLVSLGDPKGCLRRRLLATWSFSSDLASASSPFFTETHGNFTLANCTLDLPESLLGSGITRVDCLGGAHHAVAVVLTEDLAARLLLSGFGCYTRTMLVPETLRNVKNMTEGVRLKWDSPDRRNCEATGGGCRLESYGPSSEVQCAHKPGLSKLAKFVIVSIAISPLLYSIFRIACYLSILANGPRHQRQDGDNDTNPFHSDDTGVTQHAVDGAMGIDLATLASYPKAQIDAIGHVPRPNNDVCAICLSEYRPKEALRTISECAHYFHAHCIDEWLKRNASCPLCRKHEGI